VVSDVYILYFIINDNDKDDNVFIIFLLIISFSVNQDYMTKRIIVEYVVHQTNTMTVDTH